MLLDVRQMVWESQKLTFDNKAKMCNIPVRLRRKSSPFLSKIRGCSAILLSGIFHDVGYNWGRNGDK